jgi:hypothetical protein
MINMNSGQELEILMKTTCDAGSVLPDSHKFDEWHNGLLYKTQPEHVHVHEDRTLKLVDGYVQLEIPMTSPKPVRVMMTIN